MSWLSVCVSGLAASSAVISPILSPVSAKLKSSVPAISKPQEGMLDKHTLHERRYSSLESLKVWESLLLHHNNWGKKNVLQKLRPGQKWSLIRSWKSWRRFWGVWTVKVSWLIAKSVDIFDFKKRMLWTCYRGESRNLNCFIWCQNLWNIKQFSFAVMMTW